MAEATSAATRAKFIARAAGAQPADMPTARDRAGLTRDCVDKVTARGGETRMFADQLYRLFRDANTAWGRCLTVRRKALRMAELELAAAAAEGNLKRVVMLSLLIQQLTEMRAADRAVEAQYTVEVEIEGRDTPDIEVNDEDLPW